jgi:hypothetical protein
MEKITEFTHALAAMPRDSLIAGLALAAMALAAFAIHVVHSVTKERARK